LIEKGEGWKREKDGKGRRMEKGDWWKTTNKGLISGPGGEK
jgi:hypothetical protein